MSSKQSTERPLLFMKKTANYSLRTWVFTVTLAPTILVSLMLGGFYTLSLFSELETTLEEQGKNINWTYKVILSDCPQNICLL